MIELIIVLFFIGLMAGLLVGLIGVGSTLLVLPTLVLLFPHYLPHALAIKMAIATTLACTSVSVSYAAILHIKRGNVRFPLFGWMATIYVLTAFVGAYAVHFLPAKTVAVILGIVLILVALNLITQNQVYLEEERKVNPVLFLIVILIAGFSNSISGIGTGNLAIPFLSRHFPYKKAIGTSVTSAVVACVLGTIAYIVYGWHVADLPKYAIGYVYAPVFIVIAVGIVIATPIGHKLSERLHPTRLKYLLALLVAALKHQV